MQAQESLHDRGSPPRTRVLVIDDDAACRFSIRVAVPEWDVFEAEDGLAGLDLFRRDPASFDIIVLDINMPGLDGYATCLQIRALHRTIRILPFTGHIEAIPFLAELACLPALLKDSAPADIRQRLYGAIGMSPPPLEPGPAVLAFAQQRAVELERRARDDTPSMRVVILATERDRLYGLEKMLKGVGIGIVCVATSAAALRESLQTMTVGVLVSPSIDQYAALEIATERSLPLLVVVSNTVDALESIRLPATTPLGVIFSADVDIPDKLATAISTLRAGKPYMPYDLIPRLHGIDLTQREQTLVTLDIQRHSNAEIAEQMGIEVESITTYRSRIRRKILDSAPEKEKLPDWAATWLARFRGNH
jgi:DNA-binding NarL/FixJ family response regulator